MAIHKLHIDEFDEIDYYLIAIHSPLDDYRLAYYINQNLPINLRKSNCNILISSREGETQFSRFIFEDERTDVSWNLIQNQNEFFSSAPVSNTGLFSDSNTKFSTKIYLIPEFKKVDYFLKIENTHVEVDILVISSLIKKIERVSTVYPVEAEKIKSKNNLIF